MTHTNLTRGYTVALISSAVLATTAIFIRYLTVTYQLPALVLAVWRQVFVAACLLPALLALGRWRAPRAQWGFLVLYGLVLAVFNGSWTLSVALDGAAIATILVYCSTAFTAVLARWLLAEPLGWPKLTAVALSLGGCVLVSGALSLKSWQANPLGILMGVFSGLCYAVYSLMGRAAAQRGLDSWTTLGYIFAIAALFLLPLNLLPAGWVPGAAGAGGLLWLGRAWAGWGVLLALAAGPTLLGFGLYNLSLGLLPSSVANLILSSEPVFTAALAYLLLGEQLTALQMAGSLLILGGVVFLRVAEGRPVAAQPVAS